MTIIKELQETYILERCAYKFRNIDNFKTSDCEELISCAFGGALLFLFKHRNENIPCALRFSFGNNDLGIMQLSYNYSNSPISYWEVKWIDDENLADNVKVYSIEDARVWHCFRRYCRKRYGYLFGLEDTIVLMSGVISCIVEWLNEMPLVDETIGVSMKDVFEARYHMSSDGKREKMIKIQPELLYYISENFPIS